MDANDSQLVVTFYSPRSVATEHARPQFTLLQDFMVLHSSEFISHMMHNIGEVKQCLLSLWRGIDHSAIINAIDE